MTINDVEIDSDNRPVHPERVKITSTRILANPFDDIVPRRIVRHEKRKDKKDKHIEVKKVRI
jgi:peptidyl-prolyl cis-trans isomerase SDCCAG10